VKIKIKMETSNNIRLLKLLVRILETKAPLNQTSVSIGFQFQSQNENGDETKLKAKRKKNN